MSVRDRPLRGLLPVEPLDLGDPEQDPAADRDGVEVAELDVPVDRLRAKPDPRRELGHRQEQPPRLGESALDHVLDQRLDGRDDLGRQSRRAVVRVASAGHLVGNHLAPSELGGTGVWSWVRSSWSPAAVEAPLGDRRLRGLSGRMLGHFRRQSRQAFSRPP